LRSITVARKVHLTLKNFPLQMWTSATVKQILTPYSTLEYIDKKQGLWMIRQIHLLFILRKLYQDKYQGSIHHKSPPCKIQLCAYCIKFSWINLSISMVWLKDLSTVVHPLVHCCICKSCGVPSWMLFTGNVLQTYNACVNLSRKICMFGSKQKMLNDYAFLLYLPKITRSCLCIGY
jgi:hypothetical protein